MALERRKFQDIPVHWFHRDLLVDQLTTLRKDEVASLGLPVFTSSESSNERTLGIGEQGVGQLFLLRGTLQNSGKKNKRISTHLDLPFRLGGRRIRAQAVNLEVVRREIRVDIPESTSLLGATSCRAKVRNHTNS